MFRACRTCNIYMSHCAQSAVWQQVQNTHDQAETEGLDQVSDDVNHTVRATLLPGRSHIVHHLYGDFTNFVLATAERTRVWAASFDCAQRRCIRLSNAGECQLKAARCENASNALGGNVAPVEKLRAPGITRREAAASIAMFLQTHHSH